MSRPSNEEDADVQIVGGVVVPPSSGILERVREVHCDKDAVPLYQVNKVDSWSRAVLKSCLGGANCR